MNEQIVKIHNVESNEISFRAMTLQEIEQLDIEKANQAEIEKKQAEKAEAKAAAEAKLVALGLDLDDLRALGL